MEAQVQFKLDDVIGHFVMLRDQKAACKADYEAKVAKLDEDMSVIQAWLLDKANREGADSFKTQHGTAFVTTKDFAGVANWDELFAFIEGTKAWQFLNHAVNKTAVKEYIEVHKVTPPGVNYRAIKEIQVRRK